MAPFWDDIKRRIRGGSPETASEPTPVTGPDGFRLPEGDPLEAEHELLSRFLEESAQITAWFNAGLQRE